MISKNDKGEYALYNQGKLIGYAKGVKLSNGIVTESMFPILDKMMQDAAKEGVKLTFGRSLATIEEQIKIRKAYVKDKTKVNNEDWILNAPSTEFYPMAGKPGWSAHHTGRATDFDVTGNPAMYKWLVKNAIRYGFIRTVKSERWHWEYLPGVQQFAYIPKTDPSWDKLV